MHGKRKAPRTTNPGLALALAVGFGALVMITTLPVQARPGTTATTSPSQTLDQSTLDTFQHDGVKLNFEDIDVKTLARIIGQITGRSIVIDQKVQGKVTLVSPNRLSPSEAWEMFVSALEAYGFGVELVDGVHRVSPLANVKQRNTRLYSEGGGGRVLVAVIKMTKVGSEQAVNALRPLLTATGVISAVPNSNTVVVMDEASVVKRVMALARRIDVSTDKPSLRIYYPVRVRAADVSKNIESLFPDRAQLRLTVHQPTNSLLVVAVPEQHRTIERLLASLERRNQTEAEPHQFWVYYLQHAQADDTAKVLAEMLSERQRLEQQQAQSGIPTAGGGSAGVTFPLSNPNPTTTAPPPSSAMPPGSAAMPGQQDPSREFPNPQPSPIQQGAANRTSNIVYPTSQAQMPIGQQGFASAKVSADVSNNALVFYMTGSEYSTVRRLVEQLDIPRKQVLVSAIVAEVSPKNLESTGIQWQATIKGSGIVGFGAGQSIEQIYQTLQTGNFVIGTVDPTQTSINVGGTTVKFPNNYALLNFLTTTTDFNLLASPRLLTHNNKQADISVGKIVPFATGVKFDINGNPIVNFDYREVGLNLKLTPHISQGQNVRLEVHQDLQEVIDTIKTGTGASAVQVPVVSKREVNTEVSLGDGQTLVIGGLVQRTTLQTIRKIPILGDIPLLGDLLFKTKDRTVSKTTLFVFLTPHIVDSPQKAREINEQYQQMYERSMRNEKNYNESMEYVPAQSPRTSPKDPLAQPLPGPGPIPTPEALPPLSAPGSLPPPPGNRMLPVAPPSPGRTPNWQ